jgi:hypothetical protein
MEPMTGPSPLALPKTHRRSLAARREDSTAACATVSARRTTAPARRRSFGGSIVALFIFGIPAAITQQKYFPLLQHTHEHTHAGPWFRGSATRFCQDADPGTTTADEGIVIKCMKKDPAKNEEEALKDIYRRLRPGDPPTAANARALIKRLFFDAKRYDLGRVGRYKINQKLGIKGGDSRILTKEDLVAATKYLLRLKKGEGSLDDIDHLGSRRIRTVGELLANQCRVGLARTERLLVTDGIDLEAPSLPTGADPSRVDVHEWPVRGVRWIGREPTHEVGMLNLNAFGHVEEHSGVANRDLPIAIEVVHHAVTVRVHDHVGGVAIHMTALAGAAALPTHSLRVVLRGAEAGHDME